MTRTASQMFRFRRGAGFIFLMLAQALMVSSASWASRPLLADGDQGFPPYLELDYQGRPTGFAVDLLNAVAEEENLPLQWGVDAWDSSMKKLAQGEIDVLPMMAGSSEREKHFDFSHPILTSYDAIFVRRGESNLQDLEDLKYGRIIVVRGGLAHEHLLETKKYKGLILAGTTEEAMVRLADGEGEYLLMSRLPGLMLIRQLGVDDVEALSLKVDWYTRVFFFAVTEGNSDLIQSLNRGLEKVRASGVYRALFDRWIASADKTVIEQRKNLDRLYMILAVCLLALVIGSVFLLILRRMVEDKTQSLRNEIEEKKKAENAAIANEKKIAQQLYELNFIRHALDQHAIVIRIDQSRLIDSINHRGYEVSGFEQGVLPGRPVDELLFDPADKRMYESMWSILEMGKIWQGETTREVENGDRIWLNTTIVPHIGSDNRPDFYLAVSSDITRQKEVEAEQDKLKGRLQQAEKMESIGRLTGGIAHDFNNILASILGFTDLALSKYRGELNEKVIRYLDEVYRAGERARDLVAQMMDFSRISSGESKEVHLALVVKEALKMLQSTLPSSIRINTTTLSNEKLTIMMDPIKIHQIVMNLIINARDAMSGKGEISVGIREVDGVNSICSSCHETLIDKYIELSIEDTGKGISIESLQKIFDPFFTTKDIGKGTGMGLSVVHGIVHEHLGHVLVEALEGGGSRFRILFRPVTSSESLSKTQDLTTQNVETTSGFNLLVVDDDPVVGEYLEELFKTAGHRVKLHTDSQQAWEDFQQNPESYDLLVTDQTMPSLLGTELAQKVSSVIPNFPILLCTGFFEASIEQATEKLNITLLNKPVDPRTLLDAVAKQCTAEVWT